jgi:hypothetical protein
VLGIAVDHRHRGNYQDRKKRGCHERQAATPSMRPPSPMRPPYVPQRADAGETVPCSGSGQEVTRQKVCNLRRLLCFLMHT